MQRSSDMSTTGATHEISVCTKYCLQIAAPNTVVTLSVRTGFPPLFSLVLSQYAHAHTNIQHSQHISIEAHCIYAWTGTRFRINIFTIMIFGISMLVYYDRCCLPFTSFQKQQQLFASSPSHRTTSVSCLTVTCDPAEGDCATLWTRVREKESASIQIGNSRRKIKLNV